MSTVLLRWVNLRLGVLFPRRNRSNQTGALRSEIGRGGEKKAGNDPRAGVLRKTIASSTRRRDAFLEALEAKLGIAQFMACVLAQLSCFGRGSGQVSFEFRDTHAHPPRFVLTQRLYPAPPAHL
ncbi:hypothetical protein [Mesorhizobium sp. SARCC-RB16n]|uniref:hypothetical protein n=1 Tax=Mesorhizobium sp. SARCC-RB16n TaxID=2116687 RepID=UPI0016690CC2|nr:hypothetical protein [Mesorhizobium sp. SARCC-RB16n]